MRERPRLELVRGLAGPARPCALQTWLREVVCVAHEGLTTNDERVRISAVAVLLNLRAPALPMGRAFDMGEVNEYDG